MAKRLYYGQPVNRGHPLNKGGLVSEWAVVPWYKSGPRLIDLGGFRNHGTLTNGPAWVGPRGRPGGYGALSFASASSQQVTQPYILTDTEWAVSAWVAQKTSTGYQTLFAGGSRGIWLHAGKIDFYNGVDHDGATTLGASAWTHILVTGSNTAGVLDYYVNGVSDLHGTGLTLVQFASETQGIAGHGGEYLDAYLDDVCIWAGRSFSASEAAALYDQSRHGNPDRWNWVSTRSYFFGPAGGVAPGVVNPYYYRLLAGGG